MALRHQAADCRPDNASEHDAHAKGTEDDAVLAGREDVKQDGLCQWDRRRTECALGDPP